MAAMREVCARHGGQPTMDQLARAAGVSVRTLYRTYGSRDALLRELEAEPAPGARARVIATALDLAGERGLAALSMDELAAAAGVSRATLYRLFPGKPALFRELVQTFSPWRSLAQVIETATDRSPERVVPELAREVLRALSGRTGLLLRMVSDLSNSEPADIAEVKAGIGQALGVVAGYLDEQMTAGRLRRMPPILAFQLLAGPIAVHLLTRPLAAGDRNPIPAEDVIDLLTDAWLRAMAPEPPR
jgi:AcrR family transcriptional regulator